MHAFSRGWMARTVIRALFWRRLDRLLEGASFGAMRTDVDTVPYKEYKEMVRGDDSRTRLNLAIEQLRGELADKRALSGDLGLNLDSLSGDDENDNDADGAAPGGASFSSTPSPSASSSLTPNLDAMGLGRTALPKGGGLNGGGEGEGIDITDRLVSPLDRAPPPSGARARITNSVREILAAVGEKGSDPKASEVDGKGDDEGKAKSGGDDKGDGA